MSEDELLNERFKAEYFLGYKQACEDAKRRADSYQFGAGGSVSGCIASDIGQMPEAKAKELRLNYRPLDVWHALYEEIPWDKQQMLSFHKAVAES